jgi:hypothetical protein
VFGDNPSAPSNDVVRITTLAVIQAIGMFDENKRLVTGEEQERHHLRHHQAQVVEWMVDLEVFPPDADPFESRRHCEPAPIVPVAGQQTLVSILDVQEGRATQLDYAAILACNRRAAETVPSVAELLTSAGEKADRLVALLPGVPLLPKPAATNAAAGYGVQRCPNCGAPLELTAERTCKFCASPVTYYRT